MVERQRRALHRQPAVLHHHRERGVHQQRHRGLCAGLGLGHLDIVDGDAHRRLRHARTRLPQHGIGQRAGDVPRLGVAELPRPRRTRQLTGRPGPPGVAFTVPARKLLGHIAQRGLAELPHGLRRQPPLPVGAAVQEALVDQRPLQFGERARVDRRLVAELAGQRVEVDVVHRRAGVALRQLPRRAVRARRCRPSPGCPRPCPSGCRRRTATNRSSPRPAGPPAGGRRAG